jgi:hypothetical protein
MIATVEPQNSPTRRYPEPITLPQTEGDTTDYWEEVALSRLRLAQLGLVVALGGSFAVALISLLLAA